MTNLDIVVLTMSRMAGRLLIGIEVFQAREVLSIIAVVFRCRTDFLSSRLVLVVVVESMPFFVLVTFEPRRKSLVARHVSVSQMYQASSSSYTMRVELFSSLSSDDDELKIGLLVALGLTLGVGAGTFFDFSGFLSR